MNRRHTLTSSSPELHKLADLYHSSSEVQTSRSCIQKGQ